MKNKKTYNFPFKSDKLDYEEVCGLVVEDVKSNPDVVAAYLMGGKWYPGISDMDIVVVYKDIHPKRLVKSPWSLSQKAKSIFTHRYLSFDLETAKYFYFLYPKTTSNLRLLWGEGINFLDSNEGEGQWTKASILFDVLIHKLLLFPRFKNESLNVRQLIGELYSLTYTVQMVRDITGDEIGGGFPERISKLREEWFNEDPEKSLLDLQELLEHGIELVSRSVLSLDKFVQTNFPGEYPKLKFRNEKFSIKFSPVWSHTTFLKEFDLSLYGSLPFLNKRFESYRLLVPQSFSIFLFAYASGEGEFSRHILSQTNLRTLNYEVPQSLKTHVAAMNQAVYMSNKTKDLFKVPFTFGTNNQHQSLLSRIFKSLISLIRDIR